MAARVTARTAAFIPGASPPEVRTPIHFSSYCMEYSVESLEYRVDFLFYCFHEPFGCASGSTNAY